MQKERTLVDTLRVEQNDSRDLIARGLLGRQTADAFARLCANPAINPEKVCKALHRDPAIAGNMALIVGWWIPAMAWQRDLGTYSGKCTALMEAGYRLYDDPYIHSRMRRGYDVRFVSREQVRNIVLASRRRVANRTGFGENFVKFMSAEPEGVQRTFSKLMLYYVGMFFPDALPADEWPEGWYKNLEPDQAGVH